MFNLGNLKRIDITLFLTALILSVIGGLTVFSTTYYPDLSFSRAFQNQILFYLVGFFIFFALSTLNYSKLENRFVIFGIFVVTVLLLIAVLLFGDYAFDAKRWINIGAFTLQPSELTKISIILIASFGFTYKQKINFEQVFNIYEVKSKDYIKNLKKFVKSEQFLKFAFGFVSLIFFCVLILLQKSLGNTILLVLIYFSILFYIIELNLKFFGYLAIALVSFNLSFGIIDLSYVYYALNFSLNVNGLDLGVIILSIASIVLIVRYLKLNILISGGLVVLFILSQFIISFGYNEILEPYQRKRIETFLNPDSSIQLSDDYNRRQAIIAIGSGQIFGRGFLNGNLVRLQLLPFAFTDFAFAGFTEQFGLVGAIVLLALYTFLIFRIMDIGYRAKDGFGKLIAYGVASMIFLNTAQHIGMNLGLLPITGVPLPLISYGGSAVLTIFIGLGLVQSVAIKSEDDVEEVTDLSYELGLKKGKISH